MSTSALPRTQSTSLPAVSSRQAVGYIIEEITIFLALQRWVLDFKAAYVVEHGETDTLYLGTFFMWWSMVKQTHCIPVHLYVVDHGDKDTLYPGTFICGGAR